VFVYKPQWQPQIAEFVRAQNRSPVEVDLSQAFPSFPKRRISIWLGNLIEIAGIVFGFLFIYFTNSSLHPVLNIILLLAAWFCFWFFSHCLTHFVVGKILGVNFLFYFVGRSSVVKLNLPAVSSLARRIPVLGIKVDDVSLQIVAPNKWAIMFASGAVASMISPLISAVYAILHLPAWIGVFISVLTIGNIILTLVFSSKVGDLWKARKSLQA